MDYEALSKKYVLHALRRPKSVIFERAQGSRMWDIHGKMYLDTMSGSAGPAMVGHAHPAGSRSSRQADGEATFGKPASRQPAADRILRQDGGPCATGNDQDFSVHRRRRSG